MTRMTSQIFLLMAAMAVQPLLAQDASSGQIAGNIADPAGAMVPSAEVAVKSVETGQTITVTTNNLGHYVAPLLRPGNYMITVNAPGFTPLTRGPVNVPVGTSTTVNIQPTV